MLRKTTDNPATASASTMHGGSGSSGSGVNSLTVDFPSPSSSRASSPIGIAGFFSRPAKWFSRSASSSAASSNKLSTSASSTDTSGPRSSTSSRKHKISRPTDPRPILDSYASSAASKSVLELSARPIGSLDIHTALPPASPARSTHFPPSASTSNAAGSAGLGDLRSISRKPWSKSADDLGQVSRRPSPTPINTAFHDKIQQYRNRSNSNASAAPPSSGSPSSPVVNMNGVKHPFPSASSSPPRQPLNPASPISISISAPSVDSSSPGANIPGGPSMANNPPPGQAHSRSHSFTPKLPSKLTGGRLGPSNPPRKGSWGTSDPDDASSAKLRPLGPAAGPSKPEINFSNPFMGSGVSAASVPPTQPSLKSSATLLGPPIQIASTSSTPPTNPHRIQNSYHDTLMPTPNSNPLESSPQNKRSSQIIYHTGFINRLVLPSSTSAPSSAHNSNGLLPHSVSSTSASLSNAVLGYGNTKGWKPFKMEVKGSKAFLYKPPSDRLAREVKELFPPRFLADEEDESDDGNGGGDDMALRVNDDLRDLVSGSGGRPLKGLAAGSASVGRRKRVYWGRGIHPDLAVATDDNDPQQKIIEKGTFEALLHEAVFRTTFSSQDPETERRWRDFASSVMLCIPFLLPESRVKFEQEIMRCCENLIEGGLEDPSTAISATEEAREESVVSQYATETKAVFRTRTMWLIGEYFRYHGLPALEMSRWSEWGDNMGVGRAVERLLLSLNDGSGRAEIQDDEATQIHELQSPSHSLRDEGFLRGLMANIFGLSASAVSAQPGHAPRIITPNAASWISPPSNASSTPLLTTTDRSLHPRAPPHPHPSLQQPPLRADSWLSVILVELENSGGVLTREIMSLFSHRSFRHHTAPRSRTGGISPVPTGIDPAFLAQSLRRYQRAVVMASFRAVSGPSHGNIEPAGIWGTDDSPHWLTRLVLMQVLEGDRLGAGGLAGGGMTPTSPSFASGIAPSPSHSSQTSVHQLQASRMHSRPDLLSLWVTVGEICRLSGDEISWKAIKAAVTSRPIARLQKCWKRVDVVVRETVEGWVYEQSSSLEINEEASIEVSRPAHKVVDPIVSCWGGGMKDHVQQHMLKAFTSPPPPADDTSFVAQPMLLIRELFEDFRTRFLLATSASTGDDSRGGLGADVEWGEEEELRMAEVWTSVASRMQSANATRFRKVEQFMSLSLVAEPIRRGLYEPHWSRSATTSSSMTTLVPLLFSEPLPYVSLLVDREGLLRPLAGPTHGNVPTGRMASGGAGWTENEGLGVSPQVELRDVKCSRSLDGRFLVHFTDNAGRPMSRDGASAWMFGGHTASGSGGKAFWRGGTVIPVHNGQLLLVLAGTASHLDSSNPSSRASSRPSSSVVADPPHSDGRPGSSTSSGIGRTPSVRVKPGLASSLDRKTSVARRSSLPLLSMSTRDKSLLAAEPSSEPPLRVIVQAGTLDSLVDLLVHGLRGVSVSVADDNGEMSLAQGTARNLVLDRKEFGATWWSVFRSFVTPLVFFELLRKLYIRAQPRGSSASEYLVVATARLEVLEAIKEWVTIGGGAHDLLDDSNLYTLIMEFFDSPVDHVVNQLSIARREDREISQAWAELDRVISESKAIVIGQTMRPCPPPVVSSSLALDGRAEASSPAPVRPRNISTRNPLDIDRATPEELVDDLDVMASAAFSNITEEDLFLVADIFEVQSADKTGWLPAKDLPPQEEFIEMQSMFSLLQDIEPSPLISELGHDNLYRMLPPGIRGSLRAFGILRRWLISKIVAPKLGLHGRQSRLEQLLQALEIARQRSLDPSSSNLNVHATDAPCVRSAVEAIITSAILSIESRIHSKAWCNVAANRGTSPESLALILSRPFQQASAKNPLALDIGWLLERILEILSLPDLVDSTIMDGQRLINFQKRRQLCCIIGNLPLHHTFSQRDELRRRGFECLNAVEREVAAVHFDHRGIRDDSLREASQYPTAAPAANRKTIRPFHRLVLYQSEKNRRDKHLRSRLQKEKILEQTKLEKREDALNRAMRPRQKDPSNHKLHRSKKSMSSLFNFMRPLSSAFVSDSVTPLPPGGRRSAAEISFPTPSKPTLVVSLVDAHVAQFINTERNFVFRLDSEDGGHYLMQATNRMEMKKWVEVIERISTQVKKRRLTYLGNSPQQLQAADQLLEPHPGMGSHGPTTVFGVDLEALLQRENNNTVPPGTIPHVVETCLAEIEDRGLIEVGIYRIPGAVSEINSLKDGFNRGEIPLSSSTDIYAVCDVIKSWFRAMPDPVFPTSLYSEVIDIMRIDDPDDRLTAIRKIVHKDLPEANFSVLKRVIEHLDRVTEFEESNQMTAEALAIVFSPNLIRAPQNDFAVTMANMGHMHKLVKTLIINFHVVFAEWEDVDPEVDELGEEAGNDNLNQSLLEEGNDDEYYEDDDEDETDRSSGSDIQATRVSDMPPTLPVSERDHGVFMNLDILSPHANHLQ